MTKCLGFVSTGGSPPEMCSSMSDLGNSIHLLAHLFVNVS